MIPKKNEMLFTVRYAHLKDIPLLSVGDKVMRGNFIGYQGNTGKSTGKHLHIDVVDGWKSYLYKLAEMEVDNPRANPKELNYFIDTELFGGASFRVTTPYADFMYTDNKVKQKLHLAYDLVGSNDKIYWNRSFIGMVLNVGKDQSYGNFVQIGYKKDV